MQNSGVPLSSTSYASVATWTQQELYIDNIAIKGLSSSSKSGSRDTITLLQSSNGTSTDIAINSSNSGDSWDTCYLTFKDGTAEPVFDYINGVLRISDGSFNNENNNLMMYYDDFSKAKSLFKTGWKIKNSYLQKPPSINIRTRTQTNQLLISDLTS